MEIFKVFIVLLPFISTVFACNGYSLKNFKVGLCDKSGLITYSKDFTAFLHPNCSISTRGRIHLSRTLQDCNGTYVIEKVSTSIGSMPLKLQGKKELCSLMKDSTKSPEASVVFELMGIQQTCPVNAGDISGNGAAVDVTKHKDKLGLLKGDVRGEIKGSCQTKDSSEFFRHDRGKSKDAQEIKTSLLLFGPLEITNYETFIKWANDKFFDAYNKPFSHNISMTKFRFLFTVGEGTFGKVKVIKHKKEKTYFAVKIFDKSKLVEMGKLNIQLVWNEKKLLQSIDHPLIVKLEYFSQDFSYIYYVMPFVAGGELFTCIRKNGRCTEILVQFYTAQVLLAMEFLQYMSYIHRDIKPENILIDHLGFIKLADFSLCKRVTSRTYTFCGTLPYMAPEVVQGQGYGRSADWWSFGVLLYELSAGYPPFKAATKTELLTKICYYEVNMMHYFSKNLKDLLRKLLQRDLTYRFGNLRGGVDDVKNHKFFNGVNWLQLLNRKSVPPYIPKVAGLGDVSNFPNAKRDSGTRISDVDKFEEEFKDF